MKTSHLLFPVVGLISTAAAGGDKNTTTTSDVNWETITLTTDIYTTYCPSPTKVTMGTSTYTVTQSTLLTITDCP